MIAVPFPIRGQAVVSRVVAARNADPHTDASQDGAKTLATVRSGRSRASIGATHPPSATVGDSQPAPSARATPTQLRRASPTPLWRGIRRRQRAKGMIYGERHIRKGPSATPASSEFAVRSRPLERPLRFSCGAACGRKRQRGNGAPYWAGGKPPRGSKPGTPTRNAAGSVIAALGSSRLDGPNQWPKMATGTSRIPGSTGRRRRLDGGFGPGRNP
jgi:hypothetical protein